MMKSPCTFQEISNPMYNEYYNGLEKESNFILENRDAYKTPIAI